ncbi:hypothetical protein D0469_08225 [Peribacillus saganii]|uniref:YufK family protein n=1 Tax=Peribacillus saganii TaxID=2303992 RepID=A0A372LQQ1_9BACI|nr:DUF5366 family protein [Peribacillus saganii]RFU70158.1 hypothetical protein D0469_08225 [Peribacillus saganii]
MKNTYLTGYFPLISIMLFSLSFSIYTELKAVVLLKSVGVYNGMLEFVPDAGIKLSLLLVLFILFFMLFAALKLISDTVLELSLLFFSKESEGEGLKSIRLGSVIYFIGGALSLLSIKFIAGIIGIFIAATITAFIYFVYKIQSSLSTVRLIGLIFFHTFIWAALVFTVVFAFLKLYNSIMASLPV